MLAQAMEAEMIVVTVLAYNFVGDGLRDAADPYAAAEPYA
jgi:ABC-type dipeptide/oligopeptide/nickel transport system permease subunit